MNPVKIGTSKGLDLPVDGRPEATITDGNRVRSVALLGRDYLGLKPRMLVQPGDDVSLGDPLFIDKRDPDVVYAAPGSGRITAVNRGERRALLSVVIELDEHASGESAYSGLANRDAASLSLEEIRQALQGSGLWTAFRTRPFSRVPHSASTPRSVFVTATDTNPLAADPNEILKDRMSAFEAGLAIVSQLAEGDTFLCTDEDWPGAEEYPGVRHVAFTGPHPAGLVGTHIHHLDPVGADRTVWHVGYQDVIAIGILFSEGRLSNDRVIALGGPSIEKPRLVETRIGASLDELMAGEIMPDGELRASPRVISGSVLSGRQAAAGEAFLGRYHLQVSVLPPSSDRRTLSWLPFRAGGFSVSGLFAARRGGQPRSFTTRSHGRATAMLPVNAFDTLIPMDILPSPLLRALMVKDTDQAQALGCLELDAEDLALCSFVCPGKGDYGAVLRVNLEQIEREG